jgi:hypothetical protein
MEVPVVVFSIQVQVLEKLIIPKPISLVTPEIGIGAEVTLTDNITHASKVIRTLDTILKDTHVIIERLKSQLVPLVEPVDTISERPINTTSERHVVDLTIDVKHVG